MTQSIIPIIDKPSQTLNVTLSNQLTTINLYQKATGLYCNVYVNNSLIIGGVICQNLNKIVRDVYLGFIGDIFFYDSQGTSDPSTPGLGTRYKLIYDDSIA
jgi:hypothetical protein